MEHNTLSLIIMSMRPKQWTKNLVLFAALIFSQNFLYLVFFFKTLMAFFIFCVLSGCVYIINDLFDLENDRNHPLKRPRPLAAGLVSHKVAGVMAAVLLLASFLWGPGPRL